MQPYMHDTKGGTVIVSLYVDDVLITGRNTNDIKEFKRNVAKNFEMTDLEKMKRFISLEVSQG